MIDTGAPQIVRRGEGHRVKFGDLPMNFKVRYDQKPGQVAVQEWEVGPRVLGAPPHRHDHEDEVFYVLEGEVMVMQDDDIATAGAGTYVILPRGRFHTFWNATDSHARLLVILSPGRIEAYFESGSALIRPDAPPDMEGLGRLMQEYGLTMDFGRVPEIVAKYGLVTNIPSAPDAGLHNGS